MGESEGRELVVAAVADLRSLRAPASAEELADFETDVLAGLVLARSSAGLADGTIRGELSNLDQLREWFGRPLWEMGPPDADAYFGRVLRNSPKGTRLARAAALSVYFEFLELRHKAELHAMTGRVVECPLDEMNRPRGWTGPTAQSSPRSSGCCRES
jgi:integrase/recombinase XerD